MEIKNEMKETIKQEDKEIIDEGTYAFVKKVIEESKYEYLCGVCFRNHRSDTKIWLNHIDNFVRSKIPKNIMEVAIMRQKEYRKQCAEVENHYELKRKRNIFRDYTKIEKEGKTVRFYFGRILESLYNNNHPNIQFLGRGDGYDTIEELKQDNHHSIKDAEESKNIAIIFKSYPCEVINKINEHDFMKEMGFNDIKEKYPFICKSIEEIGFDNGFSMNMHTRLNVDIVDFYEAESFLSHISGKTVKEIVEKYNLPKDIASYKDVPEDDALVEFCIGEDGFVSNLVKVNKDADIAQNVLGDFFDGKYSGFFY